jgi:hypothetical protein
MLVGTVVIGLAHPHVCLHRHDAYVCHPRCHNRNGYSVQWSHMRVAGLTELSSLRVCVFLLSPQLAMGEWVHMFPEGICVQTGKLGTGVHKVSRPPARAAEIGCLKWGVGRLIAHSPDANSLVVLPLFHMGMHQLLPQHNTSDDNSVIHPTWVYSGNEVFVRAGKPIDFSDLLADYEREHGALRKLELSPDGKRLGNWGASSDAERELYARITRRVESALLELERQASEHVPRCKWARSAFVSSELGELIE